MSSPVEVKVEETKLMEEDLSDLKLSPVFGSCVAKLHTAPHFLPEDVEPQELSGGSVIETLCLSRTQLNSVSGDILTNSNLKYLYLEGNHISSLPESMFIHLPHLQWLDLRNNLIASLPAAIGLHRSLKTLLLEGNPISELPAEMGYLITLKGLNLRNCPITFPPHDIIDQGVQGILQYLKRAMEQRQVHLAEPHSEMPVVEKLQLTELMVSSVDEQDEEELEKFKELKNRMMLLERAELRSVAQSDKTPKIGPCPVSKRKKATSKASMVPELQLFGPHHWKRPEERRQAATKETKEKQATQEQRMKNQVALSKWRTNAKVTQERKLSEYRQKKRNDKEKMREEAGANTKAYDEDSSDSSQGQTSTFQIPKYNEIRSASELQRQIRVCAEMIQERHVNPRGTANEQMAAAERDIAEMTRLHRQLLETRNAAGENEKCFTIFTADNWTHFNDRT